MTVSSRGGDAARSGAVGNHAVSSTLEIGAAVVGDWIEDEDLDREVGLDVVG